jgi:hypothetical protein
MSDSLKKIFFVLIIFLGLSYGGISVWKILRGGELQDFHVYYLASQNLSHSIDPYQEKYYNYVYPPSSFLFIFPLAFIEYHTAMYVWTFGSLLSLFITCILLSKILKKDWLFSFFLFSLSLLLFPTRFTLGMGQINAYLLLFTTASFYSFEKNRPGWSGFFLGLGMGIKIIPIFFLPFFIRKKSWSTVGVALLTFTALHFFALPNFSFSIVTHYYTTLSSAISGVHNVEYYNQSLDALLGRLSVSNPLFSTLHYLALISFFGISFFSTNKQRITSKIEILEFSLFICAWLIIGGVAWQHYFIFLIIPFSALIPNLTKKQLFPTLLAFTLTAYNIKRPLQPGVVEAVLYSHVLAGTVLMYYLIWHQIKHQQKHTQNVENSSTS